MKPTCGWSTRNACSGRTGLISCGSGAGAAAQCANAEHLSLDAEAVICADRSDDFGALDDALNALAARAPRKAKVVELRFFGGLSVEETAEVLRVSPITVMREWKSAKAWLYRGLAGPTANGQ
jgi:DNA-directed RNA polymerase specialized sigma24 family protein